MAEIIEKQELPVTITKVKIGKKDLTKSMFGQIQFGTYVYHIGGVKKQELRYGLPLKYPKKKEYVGDIQSLDWDENTPHYIDGTLIGYVSGFGLLEAISKTTSVNRDYFGSGSTSEEMKLLNYSTRGYYILWYNQRNELRKGFLDLWAIDQLGIELEQIYI